MVLRTHLAQATSYECFLHFQIIEKKSKEEEYFMTYENSVQFKCHVYKFYWNTATLIRLRIIYSPFPTITAEFRAGSRDHMACRVQNTYLGTSQ